MSDYQKNGPVNLNDESIHWQQDMSYNQYLLLDQLLQAQQLQSTSHDEMLFIVMHQSQELWMKLMIHELTAAMHQVSIDELEPAFKMLSRIAHVQDNLVQSWKILSTMTPRDYSSFRDSLGQSSGFQSWQYRIIEFSLGNKNAELIEVHRQHEILFARVERALLSPSLYDLTLILLSNRGFEIEHDRIQRDWSASYVADESVCRAWKHVYAQTDEHWDLYNLAEKLIDLEYRFQNWRFQHMKTVERIIGYRPGTGGTRGVSYLAKALNQRFFPELWEVRTDL